jgi:PhzF family phenazine biosynthesis protein
MTDREMNHSESVFVRRRPNSTPSSYDIRWFTPTAEEPFCGHGILGAAHALHAAGYGTEFDFTTFMGIKASASIIPISATTTDHATISMSFPSSPVLSSLALSEDVRKGFAKALGINESKILATGQNALMDIVLELDPDLDFSASKMHIDPVALLNVSPPGTRSQVITSSWSLDPSVDFAKRVFAYGSEGSFTLPQLPQFPSLRSIFEKEC